MVISTCGFGSTGASAVLDFLRGYDDVYLLDSLEFQLVHEPDGISDLKYHLTQSRERIGCNAAIKRFLRLKNTPLGYKLKHLGVDFDEITDRYIEKLTQVSWKGHSNFDPLDVSSISKNKFCFKFQRAINKVLRTINKRWHYPRFRTRYYSLLTSDRFDDITKEYIHALFNSMGFSMERDIVTDMLFSATNPTLGMEFFDDARAIVVTRDPRDLYVTIENGLWANGFQPWDSVEKFVVYYKSLMEHTIHSNDSRVLEIHYEDLIYNYKATTENIIQFLGYTDRPNNEFLYFDPDISVKYTQRYIRANKFKQDILYIESHLPEYLYNFTEYKSRNL